MIRSISVLFALIMMSGAALAQANQQENTEARACGYDARRFCKDDIPDQFKVGSCLQANREKLSRACKAVLASHGM